MALRIIRGPENAPIFPLVDKNIAVLGFGNQGAAHALNLRDSGLRIAIGCRSGAGEAAARAAGFETRGIAEAVSSADLIIIALPDEVQPTVFESQIAPNLKPGAVLGFIHGFAIRFNLIKPPGSVGVVMIAPKGPGKTLRDRFIAGAGIPCLYAMHQDTHDKKSLPVALAWANGIGCARAGILFTTFQDETDTDLFGEQAVLCGGLTSLILAAFETLVEAGYPPELAYLECCHEVKQIADLVYDRGLAGMMEQISNTAEFGAYLEGPAIIDAAVRSRMSQTLERIQTGEFARKLRDDHARGFSWFQAQRQSLKQHAIEACGSTIRSLMQNNCPQPPSKSL